MVKLLAIDVDLTCVNTDEGWRNYLGEKYGYLKTPMVQYNFGVYYPTQDTYAYWRELDYSNFKPHEGCVDALKSLSNHFGIVFISSIKGNHTKSKYYWLKEHFPFMQGYIATKEKFLMNDSVVAMVDDRNEMLKGFDFNKRIRFKTPYIQDVECSVMMEFSKWDDNIVKEICGRYL